MLPIAGILYTIGTLHEKVTYRFLLVISASISNINAL